MRVGRFLLFEKVIVGPVHNPIMVRYILFAHPATYGIMVHRMLRTETIQVKHDHPWWFLSLVFRGYGEETDIGFLYHKPWSLLWRPASWRHRVVIRGKPGLTLVLRGPRERRWGYWPGLKWCWWRHYNWDMGQCEDGIIHEEAENNGN